MSSNIVLALNRPWNAEYDWVLILILLAGSFFIAYLIGQLLFPDFWSDRKKQIFASVFSIIAFLVPYWIIFK